MLDFPNPNWNWKQCFCKILGRKKSVSWAMWNWWITAHEKDLGLGGGEGFESRLFINMPTFAQIIGQQKIEMFACAAIFCMLKCGKLCLILPKPRHLCMAHRIYLIIKTRHCFLVVKILSKYLSVSHSVEFCRAPFGIFLFLFLFLVTFIIHLVILLFLFHFLYPLMNVNNFRSKPPRWPVELLGLTTKTMFN